MSRIRSIHPGLWTDERFVSVSPFARLLFMGLLNECDDYGSFEWSPLKLKMRLLPADGVDAPALLAELAEIGSLLRYEVDGKAYGAVRNFCQYQRPKKPASSYPQTDEVRNFVNTDARQVRDGSEPVGNQLPTEPEKPRQMKDGGGDKEGDEASSSPRRKRGGGVKPSRIAEDWKPEKPYPPDVRWIVDGWPAAALEKRLREFVDYWLSRGRDATKADWDRTWWNRIRDIDEHMAQKRGSSEPPVEQPVDSLNFDKSSEVSQIADFRRRLALAVGGASYKQWIDPLILQFSDGRLNVLALTSVAGEYVRNNFGSHFERITKQVFGSDAQVAWTAATVGKRAA